MFAKINHLIICLHLYGIIFNTHADNNYTNAPSTHHTTSFSHTTASIPHTHNSNATIEELIFHEMEYCQIDSVSIFYQNYRQTDTILNFITSNLQLSITLYDVQRSSAANTKKHILTVYTKLKQSFFLILVDQPDKLLQLADEVFRDNENNITANMPHKSKWLIMTWNEIQTNRLDGLLRNGSNSMDNVASMNISLGFEYLMNIVHEQSHPRRDAHNIHTYMWNEDRTKRPVPIDLPAFRVHTKYCTLFPNLHFGMNQRKVKVAGKMYMSKDYLDIDSRSGVEKYTGFRIHFMKELSFSMNFSFDTVIFRDNEKTVMEDLNAIQWDLSLNMWSTTTDYNNVDVTYPVHYEGLRGMYRIPDKRMAVESLPTIRTFPFPTVAILFIPGSIVFVAFIWTIVTSFNFDHKPTDVIGNEINDNDDGDEIESNKKTTGEKEEQHQLHEKEKGTCSTLSVKIRLVKTRLVKFLKIVWIFSISVVNQGASPRIRRWSSRIVIWSWCITMVIFYATYTGHLTSEMVRQEEVHPFHSFDEMLAQGHFRWGSFRDDASVKQVLQQSSDKLMRTLGNGFQDVDDLGNLDESRQRLQSILETPFVFIYFESFNSNFLSMEEGLVMMDDHLLTMNRGLGIPKNSELKDLISHNILKLHESGIIDRLMKKYNLALLPNATGHPNDQKRIFLKDAKKGVCLNDIVFLLFISVTLVIVAIIVLIIEILVSLTPLLFWKKIFAMAHFPHLVR